MGCPFLQEAHVRSCQAAPVRKLITGSAGSLQDEKCSSTDYRKCNVYCERAGAAEVQHAGRCPYFNESLVQFCGAAPVAKYVPYHDGLLSNCAGDSYRFCDLYLSLRNPARSHADPMAPVAPNHLYFAPNHMWLDVGENGACHVGIDAFLARLLGRIDRIAFVTWGGVVNPSAALIKGSITWALDFPNPVVIDRANLYLRSNPVRLAADCYGTGWLFAGQCTDRTTLGLIRGQEAARWMDAEVTRLCERIHNLSAFHSGSLGPVMNDGGTFAPGCVGSLEKDEAMPLLHDFFGPHRDWK